MKVAGADGRAGMVAIVVVDDFDIQQLASHVVEDLPNYSRPIFVRIEDALQMTGSYKYVKTGLKADGFDPAKIESPPYFLNADGKYVQLDTDLYEQIQSAQIRL